MRIEGQRTFQASGDVLRSLLTDPYVLAYIVPGCEEVERLAADSYRIVLTTRFATTVHRFSGEVRVNRDEQGNRYTLQAGGVTHPDAIQGYIWLDEASRDTTTFHYDLEVDVNARPESVSARMIETSTRAFARRFLDAVERELASGAGFGEYHPSIQGGSADRNELIALRRLAETRRVITLAILLSAIILFLSALARRRERHITATPLPTSGSRAGGRMTRNGSPRP